MTGSMNQKGEVQPIGGVNQKVEGFHDVCKVIGFTGEQGVIVPRQNLQNLMLREDVVASVREGNFRVWEASTLDDALEILTGMPAGERDKDGKYPDGTVHHAVEKSLRDMADRMKKASAPARGRKKDEAKGEEEEPEPEPDSPPPEKKKRRRPRTPGPRDEGS
jgi:predicted ATP-dependent protease